MTLQDLYLYKFAALSGVANFVGLPASSLQELGFHKCAALPSPGAISAMPDALRVKRLQNARRGLHNALLEGAGREIKDQKLKRIGEDGITARQRLITNSRNAMEAYDKRNTDGAAGARRQKRTMVDGESAGRRTFDLFRKTIR